MEDLVASGTTFSAGSFAVVETLPVWAEEPKVFPPGTSVTLPVWISLEMLESSTPESREFEYAGTPSREPKSKQYELWLWPYVFPSIARTKTRFQRGDRRCSCQLQDQPLTLRA